MYDYTYNVICTYEIHVLINVVVQICTMYMVVCDKMDCFDTDIVLNNFVNVLKYNFRK